MSDFEYFTLDDQFRRATPIVGWQSFIWTERYSTPGEFQIVTKSTYQNRQLLADGTLIGRNGSTYIMKIDTITDVVGTDGSRNLTITGFSLENLFADRVAMPGLDTLTNVPNWTITGTPGDVARELFNRVCVETVMDVHDSIPNYTFGTFLPEGNLGEPTDIVTVTASPDTLLNTLKQLCDTYSLGFRLVWSETPAGVLQDTNVTGSGGVAFNKFKIAARGTGVSPPSSNAITRIAANGGPDGTTGQTFAQYQDAQTQLGPLTGVKLFYSSKLTTWTTLTGSNSPALIVNAYPNVVPLLCWNDTMSQAEMNTFIASVPSGQEVWLCWQQEAENSAQFANGNEFLNGVPGNPLLAGWIDQNTKIRNAGNANIKSVVCSTWGRYNKTGTAIDGAYLPANGTGIIYGMDIYQHQAGGNQFGSTTWPTNGLANHDGFQKWASLVKAKGGQMAITEYGVDDTGTIAARNARIAADIQYLKNAFNGGALSPFPLLMFLYWWHNMAASNTHYKFTDGAGVAAYKAIAAAQ